MRSSRFLCAVAPVLLVLAGCSREEEKQTFTVDGPDGKAKVTLQGSENSNEGKITITGADGKTITYEASAKVDPAALEGFSYPGATTSGEGTGFSSTKTNELTSVTGALLTTDKPDVVLQHYKKLMPGAHVTSSGDVFHMLMGKTQKGTDANVTIAVDEESKKTSINIQLVTKKG
jgi:hypothetical protein